MKKLIAALGLCGALLTGCASNGSDGQTGTPQGNRHPDDVWPHTVTLPDNRQVLCVFEKQGYGGGLSCDWANAK